MLIQPNQTNTESYSSGTFNRLTVTIKGPSTVDPWSPDLRNLKIKLSANDEGEAFNLFSENALTLLAYSSAGDALLPGLSGYRKGNNWQASFTIPLPCAMKLQGDRDEMKLEVTNNSTDAVVVNLLKGIGYNYGKPFIVSKTMEVNKTTSKMPFGDYISRIVVADMTTDEDTIITGASLQSKELSEVYMSEDLFSFAMTQTDASFITGTKSLDATVTDITTELPVALIAQLHDGIPLHDVTITLDKTGVVTDNQFAIVGGFIPVVEKIAKAEQSMQKHHAEHTAKFQVSGKKIRK